jgi:hypothetical protein
VSTAEAPAAAAAPGPPESAAGAFARALFAQLVRALRAAGPEDLTPALAAVDAFVATPDAPRFLAATRLLRGVRARQATATIAALHDDRLFRRGLDAMRALPGLDAASVELLAELPADGRTGQRLVALAQLIEVHLELSGRAAAAFREIRRKLAQVPDKPRPRPYG